MKTWRVILLLSRAVLAPVGPDELSLVGLLPQIAW